jgi:hypothetical protein
MADMKIAPFAFLLLLHPISASSQESPSPSGAPVPPEIVRLEKVQVEDELKNVRVGNSKRSYLLYCNVKADGCMTPEPDKNYLLFDKNTRWKMPGATNFLTLAFMQDWKVKYNQGENIGLIPEKKTVTLACLFLTRLAAVTSKTPSSLMGRSFTAQG